jgi:hypothetical protein
MPSGLSTKEDSHSDQYLALMLLKLAWTQRLVLGLYPSRRFVRGLVRKNSPLKCFQSSNALHRGFTYKHSVFGENAGPGVQHRTLSVCD